MPALYAHRKFGALALDAAPDDIKKTIEANRKFFNYGLHGPDMFFYNRPFAKGGSVELASEIHHAPARNFFAPSVEVLAAAAKDAASKDAASKDAAAKENTAANKDTAANNSADALAAYLYGYACHFALDRACHSYISKVMSVTGASHAKVESDLEKYLILKDFGNYKALDYTGHIKPDRTVTDVIARLYPDMSADDVYTCAKLFDKYSSMMYDPSALLKFGAKIFFTFASGGDTVFDMLIQGEPDPSLLKYDEALENRLIDAVPAAVDFMREVSEKSPDALDERFDDNFEEKEGWENIEL